MKPQPPIAAELWDHISPTAQAAVLALVQQYEERLQALQEQVDELQQRRNQNSTNSARPPSSNPPWKSSTPGPEIVNRPEPKRRKGLRLWFRRGMPGFLSAVFVGLIFLAILGLGYFVLTSIILGIKRGR
ncbi:MAG TPA: DUF6444 domain-containing protein [Gemmataceae bacterium]|jgi:hypothetical protein|nr:DUF6444 domain-containing protein [Gemmataceae bacterium]